MPITIPSLMDDEYFYLHTFEYFVLVVWLEFLGENEALNCEVRSGWPFGLEKREDAETDTLCYL